MESGQLNLPTGARLFHCTFGSRQTSSSDPRKRNGHPGLILKLILILYSYCTVTPLKRHKQPYYCTPYYCSTLLYSTPLHSTPLCSTPLYSAPLHSTPFHSTPLHSIPLHSTPLHSTPLYSTPLHSVLTIDMRNLLGWLGTRLAQITLNYLKLPYITLHYLKLS